PSATGPYGHYELGLAGKVREMVSAVGRFAIGAVRHRPAAVQIHVSHYGDFWRHAPFVLLSAGLRLPCVVMVHGSRFDAFYGDAGAFRRWLIRFLLRRPSALLASGESWRRFFRSVVPGQRIEVLPSTAEPADLGADGRGAPAEPVVLFVGGSP